MRKVRIAVASERKNPATRYAALAAWATVIIGLFGVVAWFAGLTWFVRPVPNGAVNEFTTSLTAVFIGIAAVGVLRAHRGVVVACVVALLVLSGLTFYTYASGHNVWLNELGPADRYLEDNRLPGQMSRFGVVCAVVIALSALVQVFLRRESGAVVFPALGYSAVTGVSVVSLVGHASSIGATAPWSRLTGVSPAMSLGLFFGATALGVLGWRLAPRGEGRFPRWSWAPLVLGVLAATTTAFVIVSRYETQRTQTFVHVEGEQVATVIRHRAAASYDSVDRVVKLLSFQQEVTEEEWNQASIEFGQDIPGLLALELHTPGGLLPGNFHGDAPANTDVKTTEAWRIWRNRTSPEREFGLLQSGDRHYFLAGASTDSRAGEMAILALIDADVFLSHAIPSQTFEHHDVNVRWNEERAAQTFADGRVIVPLGATLPGAHIELTPTPTFRDAHATPLAVGTLLTGTVVAILMGAVMHLAFISSARSHRLERLNAELEAARDRLQRMVAALPDAVVTTDSGGRIESVNDAGLAMFGRSITAMTALNVRDLFDGDSGPDAGDIETGKLGSMLEGRGHRTLRRDDGTTLPATVAVAGYTAEGERRYAWIFGDLTKQVEAEKLARVKAKEAHELAQRYDKLRSSGAIGMAHADLKGRLVECNDVFAGMLGYSRDELIGKPVGDLNHPDDADEGNQLIRELVRGERDYYRITKRYLHRDGHPVWVDVAVALLRNEEGQPLYALGIALDVTDRMEARVALEESEARLRNVNKELESIVYVASHDLRSPLVNLQGFSRQLSTSVDNLKNELAEVELTYEKQAVIEEDLTERIPEALHFIDASTMKMDRLIKGLLRLSRLGRVELRPARVDMNELMNQVVNAMQFMLTQHHVEVEIGELPPCWGDADQINQVFSNLMDNAIKYRSDERDSWVRVSGEKRGDECVYIVEDNGQGIAPAHQKIIFEVFHRLSPRDDVGGEGLGLSVVRRILDRSRGTVELQSDPGKGSRFIVTLPAHNIHNSKRQGPTGAPK